MTETALVIIEVPVDPEDHSRFHQAAKTAAYGVWSVVGGEMGPKVRLCITQTKDAVLAAFDGVDKPERKVEV